MKIPAPVPNIAELYTDLADALNALEQAGEEPLRGFTIFSSADSVTGTTGRNGYVQRVDSTWTGGADYSDYLHDTDGKHQMAPSGERHLIQRRGSAATKRFSQALREHLHQHAQNDQ